MKIIVNNIKYELDTYNPTAKVIGYKDDPVDVIIPDFIEYENEKYKVTSIGMFAFYWCDSLTFITIPNSVTSIREFAFYNCSSLTSITIPNSVTSIGNGAFSYCSSLTSFIIPNSVTSIGDSAFIGCTSLTSVTIPNSVTSIGTWVFSGCNSLTSIDIPNSVTSIGCRAFYQCSRLTSIDIPNSITSIGISAFDVIGMTLSKRYTKNGKLIAYKAFRTDMTCRNFQYEEGKTFEIEGEIKCCECGFHACINPLDIFNYYWGTIGTDIYIHEVYLSGDIDEENCDSKVCASKIEIGRRLTIKDINDIINSK